MNFDCHAFSFAIIPMERITILAYKVILWTLKMTGQNVNVNKWFEDSRQASGWVKPLCCSQGYTILPLVVKPPLHSVLCWQYYFVTSNSQWNSQINSVHHISTQLNAASSAVVLFDTQHLGPTGVIFWKVKAQQNINLDFLKWFWKNLSFPCNPWTHYKKHTAYRHLTTYSYLKS